MSVTPIPPLLPWPASLDLSAGPPLPAAASLAAEYRGVRTPRLERAVARCLERAGRDRGGTAAVPLIIECAASGAAYPALEDDERYRLAVAADAVRVTAPREWGVLRALATLTQLLGAGDARPLEIDDRPRFPWRGLMLDVARHFLSLDDLLRTLEAMELCKLDVLHLHLSDDQGFRFPSRRYPRLASPRHYRRDELERLVAAAADRGIRVVPELDVPGHVTCWLTAYPEWGPRAAAPTRRFGVHPACLDPTRPEVQSAVAALFSELAEVFPDTYLHFGGDEVHDAWWRDDPRIAAHMRREGTDAAGLQARFHTHVAGVLDGLGRRAVGWDEVLHRELPRQVTVQAWRGVTARDRALAAGHDCVLSAPYYLDLQFPADVHYRFDPAAPQAALVAAEDALLEDPRLAHVAAGMAWTRQWREGRVDRVAEGGGRLLGAEACLWSELVDGRVLDVRLWSRLPALAERFWSPAERDDVEDLHRRLTILHERLPGWVGVDVAGDSRRLMAGAGLEAGWRPLAEMLEPVKWYGRLLGEQALAARLAGREMPRARPYDADTPLDRVVDALPPESPAVRRLAVLCRRERGGDAKAAGALRELAETWRDLPARAGPAELVPCAAALREVGDAVLRVLDGAPAAAVRPALERALPPRGEYLLAAAPVLLDWLEGRADAAPESGASGGAGSPA